MPANLYEALWIFMIYSFAGWCTEVAYAGLNKGEFVNRGFLNGPYCPIYGCGVLIVVVCLTPLKENLLLLFLGSVALTSFLEYMTGLILEKAFGNKWWDYSDVPFNIEGYICLKFSILWGLGCMFIMTVIHPGIYKMIRWIPKDVGIVVLTIFSVGFSIDAMVTVRTILKFNHRVEMLELVAVKIHDLSDDIGEDIFEGVSELMERTEDARLDVHEFVEDKKEELQELFGERQEEIRETILHMENLRKEYRSLIQEKQKSFHRLTKAFPNMSSKKHNQALQHYKEFLKGRH